MKLPDQGARVDGSSSARMRRAMLAGMITSAQGVLGSPSVSKPKLG